MMVAIHEFSILVSSMELALFGLVSEGWALVTAFFIVFIIERIAIHNITLIMHIAIKMLSECRQIITFTDFLRNKI